MVLTNLMTSEDIPILEAAERRLMVLRKNKNIK